uniref:Uncharacterized protein n=1 Tax=Tanacetum cinerariifolium TaxID=118510 RepID=A0A699ICL7_TANCI|nr:hypothetical protein [Tanacetum cinerariifolium]
MINSIKNGDQPLPRVTQVSIARTSSTEQPPLKDKSMWSDQEKRIKKIDCLARSLLIQGLPNDIYSLIDINKTAKDLWDALARHMLGSEYGEQDKKAAILYYYETFKANEGELLLDTYIRYLQVINDLKKCGYSKDNCESNFKFLNYLQPEWKQMFYSKPTNNNLKTSSTSQSANKKQEFVKTDDKKVKKKADEKKRDMSKVKCYNYKKEGHFAKDYKKTKVKDYEYYKTKMLLAKKDKDEQVLLAKDQAWMELSSDPDQEINENMVFMVQIKKVLSDSKASSSSIDEKISEHVVIDTHAECQEKYAKLEAERYEYMIRYFAYFDNDKQHRKLIADQEVLYDKMSVQLVELDKHVRDLKNTVLDKDFKIFELEECVRNKDLEIEKCLEHCDKEENPKVIAPGMFKLSVSQSVSPISMSKRSYDSNNVEIKLKRKRHLDTFSSVRRPKNSGVIWKKNGSSNTSNVGLSAVSVSNLNKNVKRYSRKDLLACNNSHLGETSSAYMCNDAMNVSWDSRMNDLLDDNNLFIFDDESVKIPPVSKMTFRKKPRDSMNLCSKSNSNKSLPRTVHEWLPKLQPLPEPIAKWFPRIVQICLWILDSRCLKHMTGNRALLTNFMKKFLGTVCFGNNDFTVIAGYGDVVIGSMMIKKSTCFVRNEDGVDLLTGDRSSNLYTIALNEVASNSSTCLLAKAPSQSWLWHQRLSHLNFATINDLVKKILVQGLPKMKFKKDHLCSACEQWKIHQKHYKSKTAFASNKPLYLLHMDFLEPGLSNLNETEKSSNPSVSKVSEASKKDLEDLFQDFYDEYFDSSKIMKSSTMNVETSINEEVFHEVSETFQGESSSSSLNDDVQQSPEEVILPSPNT